MEYEEQIKQIFADILDVKEERITETFGPNDAAMWDSMNNLRLITALEEEFKIQLTMGEIREMDSFGKIKEVVGRHLAS
jgi:acyl carrier protein